MDYTCYATVYEWSDTISKSQFHLTKTEEKTHSMTEYSRATL